MCNNTGKLIYLQLSLLFSLFRFFLLLFHHSLCSFFRFTLCRFFSFLGFL